MRLDLVCFYCLCVFVYVLYFIATMSFAGYSLSVLFCLLSIIISDSRFDLVWFRLSCDHGWIRSESVNVRKQQQQQTTADGNISLIIYQAPTLHPSVYLEISPPYIRRVICGLNCISTFIMGVNCTFVEHTGCCYDRFRQRDQKGFLCSPYWP